MNTAPALLCLTVALSTSLWVPMTAANAQDADSLDGKWTVKFVEDGRHPVEARLELKGALGQYRRSGSPVHRPADLCDKSAAPVNVETAGDSVVITAKYSAAVRGCSDLTLRLKRTHVRSLEGAFSDGTPVSVTRN